MAVEELMTTDEIAKDHDKWLALRTTGLGGSDIAAMLGVSPWKSTYELWLEKTGTLTEDKAQEDERLAEILHFGNVLEQVVADEFELRTGKKVSKRGMVRSVEHPCLLADVDRVVEGENAILECKTTSSFKKDEWEDDCVPAGYYLQVQTYMAVGGYDKCYVACLIGGNQFVIREVPRNEEDIKQIIAKAEEFWNKYVVTKTAPPVDGSAGCTEALKKMYPGKVNTPTVKFTREQEKILQEIINLKKTKKEVDDSIAVRENTIKSILGDNVKGETGNYEVSLSPRETKRFDTTGFKKKYPDMYEKWSTTTTSRVLRVKEIQK